MRLASIVFIALFSMGLVQAKVAGRVVDSSGKPLPSVRVMSLPWEDGRTDDAGRFQMSRPAPVVRFSKDGYQPTTIPTDAITADVVLRQVTAKPWKPPVCSQSRSRRFGDAMRFASLRGVRVREVSDDHYRMVSLQYGGATLVFGTGPHWNYGLPSLATLKAMVEVQERDVETPWGFPAAEYRGRRHDGTQWREILIFGESIEYDEARATVAAHFDAVMDSLCFEAATAG